MVWNEQIHTGLFNAEKSLDQAVRDTTKFLADKAEIKKGNAVLTVGCGRGGADRFFAAEKGAIVTGVDLSQKQLETGESKAQEMGLTGKINYVRGSMTELPIAADSQDFVWAQESFFYCTDRPKAIAEFARVLKDGGIVILEDTTLEDPDASDEVYEKFCVKARAPKLMTAQQYAELFASLGLTLTFSENWSKYLGQTYKSIIEKIQQNREEIKTTMETIYGNYAVSLDKDFGFPESMRLVEEGKLGCQVLIFKKLTKNTFAKL